jgi:hypothetical protein
MKELLEIAPRVNLSLCCFDENRCESREGTWHLNGSYVYKPPVDSLLKSFPYKPASIISSTFAEVLFLDCDAYVVRDPEPLFLTDPMYHRFGALFFPDAFVSRQHPRLWTLLNTSCAEDEYELDSATILVNKAQVWRGLVLAKLINDHHQTFYGVFVRSHRRCRCSDWSVGFVCFSSWSPTATRIHFELPFVSCTFNTIWS